MSVEIQNSLKFRRIFCSDTTLMFIQLDEEHDHNIFQFNDDLTLFWVMYNMLIRVLLYISTLFWVLI